MRNSTAELKSGYKLILKGDGITVERNVSESLAKDIIAMILVGDGVPQITSKAPTNTEVPPQHLGQRQNNLSPPRKSLREYLNEVGAKKNPQKILAIANFLVKHIGKATFSISDIRPQFRTANEQIPANLNRDFQTLVQFGWIAPDHAERKMFFVTQTGLDALKNRFE